MYPNIPYIKDENLPSLQSVIEGFRKIEYLNEGNYDYETIKNAYFENIKLFPNLVAPEGKWGIPIYRTSIIDNPNIDITDIRSFSFPLPEFCTEKGRCNLVGYPVFYAAVSIVTALRERRKKNETQLTKGDEVYISHWKIKDNVDFRYAQFIFSDDVKLGDLIKNINISNKSKIKDLSKCYSLNKQQSFEYLNDKFSEFFLSNSYNFSSFIAHNILYENSKNVSIKADAIAYPSLQDGYNSLNFAIHPDFVQNNLELLKVHKVRFNEFVNEGVSLILLEVGIPNKSNKIDWHFLTFSLNKQDIVEIGLMFENEPFESIFNDSHEFLYNGKKDFLPNIVWKIIEQKGNDINSLLGQIEEEPVLNKTYIKEFVFEIGNGLLILKKDNIDFKIINLKVVLHYEILLEAAHR